MRVYATELICSTGVLGFHTFKLALCIYNKLRSHAEILSWWAFDFQSSEVQSVRFEHEQWPIVKSKIYSQSKQLLDKNQRSKFCQSSVKQTHFQNLKKKRKWFFWSLRGTLKQLKPSLLKHLIYIKLSAANLQPLTNDKKVRINEIYKYIYNKKCEKIQTKTAKLKWWDLENEKILI